MKAGAFRLFPKYEGEQCTSAYGAIIQDCAVVSWFSGKPWYEGTYHTFPGEQYPRLVTADDIAAGFPPQQLLERIVAEAPQPSASAYNITVVLKRDLSGGFVWKEVTKAHQAAQNAAAAERYNG